MNPTFMTPGIITGLCLEVKLTEKINEIIPKSKIAVNTARTEQLTKPDAMSDQLNNGILVQL